MVFTQSQDARLKGWVSEAALARSTQRVVFPLTMLHARGSHRLVTAARLLCSSSGRSWASASISGAAERHVMFLIHRDGCASYGSEGAWASKLDPCVCAGEGAGGLGDTALRERCIKRG
jgi:hypothetical protein